MSGAAASRLKPFGFLLVYVALIGSPTVTMASTQKRNEAKEIWIGDVLSNDAVIRHRSYVLRKRYRRVVDLGSSPSPIDVSYAVLHRKGKPVMKFDANVYFSIGNNTSFGWVSILGNRTEQAIISQDIYRGGAQWVVTLSRRPRVIFDGHMWAVGRESDDMGLVDLDGDNVSEITVPITDFYQLRDKMSMSQIPLPTIVFRYDCFRRTYLPANRRFRTYLLQDSESIDSRLKSTDLFEQRSNALKKLLTYIYCGRRAEGWRFFDRTYTLDDREEIRNRVKSILRRQAVYKFIYNHPKKRR